MVYVSVSRRRTLKRQHKLACPTFLGYPLSTRKQVRSALSRYHQRKTRKCSGGATRICRAASRLGIHASSCPIHGASELRGMKVRLVIR